jgi:hypothetical protein
MRVGRRHRVRAVTTATLGRIAKAPIPGPMELNTSVNGRVAKRKNLVACLPDGARLVTYVSQDEPPEVFYAAYMDKLTGFIGYRRSGGFRIY